MNDADRFAAKLRELELPRAPSVLDTRGWDTLGDDVVKPSLPVEDTLANAPAREGNFFVVPAP